MVHRVTRDGLRHSAPRANKIRQSIRCPWMHQIPELLQTPPFVTVSKSQRTWDCVPRLTSAGPSGESRPRCAEGQHLPFSAGNGDRPLGRSPGGL
jgi:hypothetical protein